MTALLCSAPALAYEVPEEMHFQAFLTDAAGDPVDDTLEVTLRFYEGDPGNNVFLYEESQDADVAEGVLAAGVGSEEPLDLEVFDTTKTIWFQIEIAGDVLEPAYPIRSVPYATWAANAPSVDEFRDAFEEHLRRRRVAPTERSSRKTLHRADGAVLLRE